MSTTTLAKYNITEDDGKPTSVMLFVDTKSYLATAEHPNFGKILRGCQEGMQTDKLVDLFDASVAVGKKFARAKDVKVKNGIVYLKGKPVHNAVCDEIIRFHAAGLDFKPLVNFMRKVEDNPTEHSKENLFHWLERNGFALADDGDILAYKGVQSNYDSCTSGPGIVNGKSVKYGYYLSNKIGNVVEMDRSMVEWNPKHACARGLHVGNFAYARDFGTRLIRVKVHPADCVSVPTDCGGAKMRVCKYRVVMDIDRQYREDPRLHIAGAFRTAKMVGTDSGVDLKPDAEKVAPAPRKGAKRKPAPRVAQAHVWPEFYEDFNKRNFDACAITELKWLAKEWAMDDDVHIVGGISRAQKPALVKALVRAAAKRRKLLVV